MVVGDIIMGGIVLTIIIIIENMITAKEALADQVIIAVIAKIVTTNNKSVPARSYNKPTPPPGVDNIKIPD